MSQTLKSDRGHHAGDGRQGDRAGPDRRARHRRGRRRGADGRARHRRGDGRRRSSTLSRDEAKIVAVEQQKDEGSRRRRRKRDDQEAADRLLAGEDGRRLPAGGGAPPAAILASSAHGRRSRRRDAGVTPDDARAADILGRWSGVTTGFTSVVIAGHDRARKFEPGLKVGSSGRSAGWSAGYEFERYATHVAGSNDWLSGFATSRRNWASSPRPSSTSACAEGFPRTWSRAT